jgi:heterodisulfide reductase subunit A
MSRIGVFICHCGHNIAGTVDVEKVASDVLTHPDVVFAVDYKYMCSDPGQYLIKRSIEQHHLDGVVVAACSPAMHETTFRKAVSSVGLNEYRCESANIREQVSWVHQDEPDRATEKATKIVRSIVEKVSTNEELDPITLKLTRRTLVIGGGIAGMQAALDIADSGLPVILVEKTRKLGGKMAQLSGTYLNFKAAPGMLEKMAERVMEHPSIEVFLNSKVVQVSGYVGNFKVLVNPVSDAASPAATPDVLEEEGAAQSEIEVGAIILATGWDRYDMSRLSEYGSGQIPDVIDGLAFENMLAEGNEIRRPSDGRVPREIVFVQCAGSRDPEKGVSYCSKVCCMVVAKQAMMFRERISNSQAYVFYIDIRSAGKGYDEYVQTAMEDFDVVYLRGKVSKIFREGDKVIVWGVDTLAGRSLEIVADLVVLATPMYPADGAVELAQTVRVGTDSYGWFNEAHIKLRPVETLTAGIFLAGAAQGPKDIPETVGQAGGAAGKVLQLFSNDEMTQSPMVAEVIPELCAACGACVLACPYQARQIHPLKHIATVNASLCQSCGACVTACPNKACYVHNWRPDQIMAMIDEVNS